ASRAKTHNSRSEEMVGLLSRSMVERAISTHPAVPPSSLLRSEKIAASEPPGGGLLALYVTAPQCPSPGTVNGAGCSPSNVVGGASHFALSDADWLLPL